MKIAIFGGSFNPVHSEHMNMVKAAISALSLDKVIVMPSFITPQKSGRLEASAKDRLNMCRLAFEGIDCAEVSDYELTQEGISYSYLTCRTFRQKYPDDELIFIVGADMLANFPSWREPEEILKCVTLAVCARESEEGLKEAEQSFKRTFGKSPLKFDYIGKKVSSTRIRVLCALCESIDGYTPEKVSNYIKENSLYLLPELLKVKKYLTPERWGHTVRVALTAAENCARAGVDEKTAITAAALHDCAKYLKADSPELSGFTCPESVPEPVVHQYAGAHVAEHVFGVKDEAILNAIKYHTSGRDNMSPLEKLIYLSDMLEEGRTFKGVENLRKEFEKSIDGAMYASLKFQLEYLERIGKPIYSETMRAYNFFKEQL